MQFLAPQMVKTIGKLCKIFIFEKKLIIDIKIGDYENTVRKFIHSITEFNYT